MKTSIFTESLDLSEAQIDADNHLLKGVVLIRSGMSLNRRFYSEDVLKNAVKVFEATKSYDSHKKGERQVSEISGWYSNVRYEEGALRADRYFSRTRAGQDVWSIAEDIVSGRAPRTLAGLSINAVGTGKSKKFDDGDALNVESISAATSIDDVSQPAAGGTYLTASNGDEMTEAILQALTFEEWFESRPEYIKRVQNEMKTIRQDDALKAVKAEAEDATQALREAQSELETLKAERDAAIADRDSKARALALEEALSKVQLPAAYKTDLRTRLPAIAIEQWESVIETEIAKAKSGVKPTIPVTGAGQQIAQPIAESKRSVDPMIELRARLARAKTPAEHATILQEMRS